VFIALAAKLMLVTPSEALKLALAIWFIGPLPVIGTYLVWIKMHRLNAFAHALGWLTRFVVCAFCVAFIYRGH
jgi:hypothetical protein